MKPGFVFVMSQFPARDGIGADTEILTEEQLNTSGEEIFLVCQECGHVRDTHKMPEDGEVFCPNCGSIEWCGMTDAEIEQKEKIDQRLKNPKKKESHKVRVFLHQVWEWIMVIWVLFLIFVAPPLLFHYWR